MIRIVTACVFIATVAGHLQQVQDNAENSQQRADLQPTIEEARAFPGFLEIESRRGLNGRNCKNRRKSLNKHAQSPETEWVPTYHSQIVRPVETSTANAYRNDLTPESLRGNTGPENEQNNTAESSRRSPILHHEGQLSLDTLRDSTGSERDENSSPESSRNSPVHEHEGNLSPETLRNSQNHEDEDSLTPESTRKSDAEENDNNQTPEVSRNSLIHEHETNMTPESFRNSPIHEHETNMAPELSRISPIHEHETNMAPESSRNSPIHEHETNMAAELSRISPIHEHETDMAPESFRHSPNQKNKLNPTKESSSNSGDHEHHHNDNPESSSHSPAHEHEAKSPSEPSKDSNHPATRKSNDQNDEILESSILEPSKLYRDDIQPENSDDLNEPEEDRNEPCEENQEQSEENTEESENSTPDDNKDTDEKNKKKLALLSRCVMVARSLSTDTESAESRRSLSGNQYPILSESLNDESTNPDVENVATDKNADENELAKGEVRDSDQDASNSRRLNNDQLENQLTQPASGPAITDLSQSRVVLMDNARVCYACSTTSDPSCWLPDKTTTVKYCKKGHNSCVVKSYKTQNSVILIRDCGNTCNDNTLPNILPKYKSCRICNTDQCNGAYSVHSFGIFIIVSIVSVAKFSL